MATLVQQIQTTREQGEDWRRRARDLEAQVEAGDAELEQARGSAWGVVAALDKLHAELSRARNARTRVL